MSTPRDADPVYAIALQRAVEKIHEGCESCAEGYLDEARRSGATEDEISLALAEARKEAGNPQVSRRQFLKGAAESALGLAVVGSGLLPHLGTSGKVSAANAIATLSAETAGDMAVTGAQIAWLWGLQKLTPMGEYRLAGISPQGTVVGQLGPLQAPPLRSLDGNYLYVVWANKSGTSSASNVEVYNAAIGALERTLIGQTVTLNASQDFDALKSDLSKDGRYLAVLHQTQRTKPGTEQKVTKVASGGTDIVELTVGQTIITTAVEVFDVQAGRTLGYFELNTSEETLPGGNIAFAPDGRHIYISTSDRRFNSYMTVVEFDGKSMQVQATATNARGPILPPTNSWQRRGYYFQSDGTTLVSFDGSYVRWFDLRTFSLKAELALNTFQSAKPSLPASVIAPDGSRLYSWNALSKTVSSIDLTNRITEFSFTLPEATAMGTTSQPNVGISAVAINPESTRLYVSDSGAAAGLSIFQLPDLKLVRQVLPHRATRAIWLTQDGQTVFALGERDGLLSVLQPDGSVVATLDIGTNFYEFVTS